jgi:hypothetical protein
MINTNRKGLGMPHEVKCTSPISIKVPESEKLEYSKRATELALPLGGYIRMVLQNSSAEHQILAKSQQNNADLERRLLEIQSELDRLKAEASATHKANHAQYKVEAERFTKQRAEAASIEGQEAALNEAPEVSDLMDVNVTEEKPKEDDQSDVFNSDWAGGFFNELANW